MKRLEHLRRYPFLKRDEERIRVRAYYHHQAGTHAGDAVADWLQAEREELEAIATIGLLNQGARHEFEVAYEAPVSHVATLGERGASWIGTRHPRRCALCTEPSPTFRTDAHLLAESFGNRSLFSLDECDDCNQRSGRELDHHLATMFLGDRVLAQLPKKRGGGTKAKFGKGRSSVGGTLKPDPLRIEEREGDASVEFTVGADGQGGLTLPPVKYRPIAALRAIGRAAYLALPPDRRAEQQPLLEWVTGTAPTKPTRFWRFFYPTPFETVGITVWTRRPGFKVPGTVAMFHSGHTLVLIAPNASEDMATLLPPIPKPFPDAQSFEGTAATALSDEVVTERPAYSITGTDRVFLHEVADPLPVTVSVELNDEKLLLDGTLTTPNPSKPEQLIAYRVDGGDIPGILTIVSRDRCRTWNCELAMDVTPKAMEILRLLKGGAAMKIVDARGRQIYPIARGWMPPWKGGE